MKLPRWDVKYLQMVLVSPHKHQVIKIFKEKGLWSSSEVTNEKIYPLLQDELIQRNWSLHFILQGGRRSSSLMAPKATVKSSALMLGRTRSSTTMGSTTTTTLVVKCFVVLWVDVILTREASLASSWDYITQGLLRINTTLLCENPKIIFNKVWLRVEWGSEGNDLVALDRHWRMPYRFPNTHYLWI